jgi:hypothetical protein
MADTYQATISATVTGKGKFIFTYAFNSWTWQNTFAFSVNGKQQWQHAYNNNTSFSGTVTNEVSATGQTTFSWTLVIADSSRDYGHGYSAQSGAWLSNVRWIPERDGVEVEGIFIPVDWFSSYFSSVPADAAARETLACTDSDGDGFENWKEYLCGTDPTDSADHLRATFRMVDGAPVVDWNLSAPMDGAVRIIEGTPSLPFPAWSTDLSSSTFFRVRISPP